MNQPDPLPKCPNCGQPLDSGGEGGPPQCPHCLAVSVLSLALDGEAPPEPALRRLGQYELLEEIGRGGMGVVFRARQGGLARDVAVKIMRESRLAAAEAVGRFRAEATAVGRLSHPNIVPVFEVGEVDGEHFLAMGLVRGPNLADATREGPIAARRAAELTAKIARAIQHAHEQGILHRDLKPANILLDGRDEPHVTDFGLARQFDSGPSYTKTGQILGTPAYMAPEQARSVTRLGPAADVYSLGALLFHLLTGRPPFVGESVAEVLRHVEEQEPVSPRILNPAVPEDLASVCLRCLEKDPGRRYPDAANLAADLDRFREGRPTVARPAGRLERAWRWCRREPLAAGLATAAVVLLVATAAVSIVASIRESRARDVVEVAERKARDRLTESLISLARAERISGKIGARDRALEAIREAVHNGNLREHYGELRDEAANSLLMFDFKEGRRQNLTFPTGGWVQLPDGIMGSIGSNGVIRLRLTNGATLNLRAHPPFALPLISADSRWIAVAEGPGVFVRQAPRRGEVETMAGGLPTRPLFPLNVAGADPFSELLLAEETAESSVTNRNLNIALWRLSTGELLGRFPGQFIQFSPDSRWAFVFDVTDRGAQVLDLQTGARVEVPGAVFLAAWSPDGRRLALAQRTGVSLWRLPEVRLERWIPEVKAESPGGDMAFSADSTTLATALPADDEFAVVRLVSLTDFSVTTPTLPEVAKASPWGIDRKIREPIPIDSAHKLRWLRRGSLLIEGRSRLLELEPKTGFGSLPCGSGRTNSVPSFDTLRGLALDPSESRAAVVGSFGLELWDWNADTLLGSWPAVLGTSARWEGESLIVAERPEGGRRYTESWYERSAPAFVEVYPRPPSNLAMLRKRDDVGECWMWGGADSNILCQGIRERVPRVLGRLEGLRFPLNWDASGKVGVQADRRNLRLLRLEDGAEGVRCVSTLLENHESAPFSPWTSVSDDGRWIVTSNLQGSSPGSTGEVARVRVIEASTGRTVREVRTRDSHWPTWQLSADGTWLLIHGDGLTVWSVSNGARLARLPLMGTDDYSVRLSPDKRWIAGSLDQEVRLVDTRTWGLVWSFPVPSDVRSGRVLDFSSDSEWLAVRTGSHEVSLFNLKRLRREVSLTFPSPHEIQSLEFAQSGRRLLLSGSQSLLGVDLDGLRDSLKEYDLAWKSPGEGP